MTVEVADHATVRDAVGFACLEYTRANRYCVGGLGFSVRWTRAKWH